VNTLENYKNIQATASAANVGTVELPAPALPPETQKVPNGSAQSPMPTRRSRKSLVVAAFVFVVIMGLIAYRRSSKPKLPEQPNSQTVARQATPPPTPPAAPPSPTTDQSTIEKPAQPSEVVQKRPAVEGKTTATMTVNTNPPTATFLVDGKSTGMRTPAQLQLTRGEHQVSVRMEGFQPSSAKFQVKGGEELQFAPDLNVQVPGIPNIRIPKVDIPAIDVEKLTSLQKDKQLRSSEFWQQWAKGTEASVRGGANSADLGILVHTKPTGANISINGNDTGNQSPAILPENPGTYRVRVLLDGYEPVEREVKVEPGRPAMVNITLKPIGKQP
jgi:hypothetical protein